MIYILSIVVVGILMFTVIHVNGYFFLKHFCLDGPIIVSFSHIFLMIQYN